MGGFQVSGIVVYNTGLPFTAVTSNYDPGGTGIINANPTARPNLLCNPNQNAPNTPQQFFNTACFQANPTNTELTNAANVPGNAGRGIIFGPSTSRVDFTLAKTIRFSERFRLQLRGELFNVFNTTSFRGFVGLPNALNVTNANFGSIGSVRDPRTAQLAAKFNF